MIVLILMAVGLVGWFGYSQQRDLNALSTDTQLKQAYDRVRDVLKARENQALTLSHAIANSPGFAEHLDRKDRDWLFENFTPTFLAARAQGIDLINGFRPPGINEIRWHNPTVFGDSIVGRRLSVTTALSSGRPQAGLEQGLGKSLGLFAPVPVRIGDRIVGVVDAGSFITQTFADDIKKRLGVDVGFHVRQADRRH